jgi:hypothetical protein
MTANVLFGGAGGGAERRNMKNDSDTLRGMRKRISLSFSFQFYIYLVILHNRHCVIS